MVSGLPPSPNRALPPLAAQGLRSRSRARTTPAPGCPSRHFGENQLSPRSLGISPLSTAHPKALQRPQVRPSSPHYRTFSLAMGSSRGFGSHRPNCSPASDSLSLRLHVLPTLNLACPMHSPAHSSIGTPSPSLPGLRRFVGTWFQDLFHSPPGVLFTFPSRYSSTIGRLWYLALEGGPPSFPRDSP